MLPVETAFKTYAGLDGNPLHNGYVYFGQPNLNPVPEANRITVYWDAAGTQPADQPLRTVKGYIVRNGTPANVFVSGAYSELVQDSKKRQVYFARTSNDFAFGSILSGSTGSSLVGFIQSGTGAVPRTVQTELRERISVTQFGAVGNGVTDDTTAIQNAINFFGTDGGELYFPKGVYLISAAITGKTNIHIRGAFSGRDTLWTVVTIKATAAGACLDFRDCDHYFIENLRFDGNNTATSGIKQGYTSGASHVAHCHIEKVTIQSVTGTAIDTGSGFAAGAVNDCTYKDVIIELCGLGYDFYSTNNLIIGGVIAGCTTTGGIRLNTTSEAKAYGTVFSGNKADIIPAGNDFVNGIRCFGTWHETSVDGIIKRYTVPSVNKAIASIVFDGCVLHTSNATNLFDLTNCEANVVIISGRKDPAAPAQVVIPANNTVISMGLLDELIKSGAGNLVKMNTGGIAHSSTTGAIEMGWMKAFGGNIAAASLPGNEVDTGAMIIGWNRSNGDGEMNLIGAKGGGTLGGVSLGYWDGAAFAHLFWAHKSGTIFIKNTTSVPGGNPVGGGYFYVEAGALKFKGSAGTVTTIAPA